MITTYRKLTGKYLSSNKKRSILTIIGIVLSAALICTIGFFIVSMQNAEIESVKSKYGSWHVSYTAPDKELAAKVTGNPKVSRSGFYQQGENIKINEEVSVSSVTASDSALELLPYKIKTGRFPQNDHEAAVENWVLRYVKKDAKLGDRIKLNGREYTLAGILQDNVSSQVNKTGIFLSRDNNIDRHKSVLLAEISPKTNLKRAVSELDGLPKSKTVKAGGRTAASVVNNSPLIDIQGGGDGKSGLSGLYSTVAIVVGIVLVAAIAVIYNSFQISVVERMRQFGLLRAIGATPAQIRKIVLREASVLSLIGVPLGILCGIIAIFAINFIFRIIGKDMVSVAIKVSISPEVMLISAAVSIAAIYISALLPALFAGRISPLSAISGRTAIVKEKIKRRKNMIVNRLFKFEGNMAYKNIKRNRKRYRITVFSIAISVVLFVTFKSFMDMTLNLSGSVNESKNIHFSLQSNGKNSFIKDKIIEDIDGLNSVSKIYKMYNEYNFVQFIDGSREIEAVKSIDGIYGKAAEVKGEKKIPMNGVVTVYDENALEASKKYLQSGSIDVDKLNGENGVILVNKNVVYNKREKKSYVGPVANIKAGDEIELKYSGETRTTSIDDGNITNSYREAAKNGGDIKKVKVLAVLKDEPFDLYGQNGLKLITTGEVAEKLTGINDIRPVALNIAIKDVKNENSAKDQIENIIKSDPSLSVINYLDKNRSTRSVILMIEILVYGFVVVVSLIGSVNIINTLTTNIILRRREFAILKAIGLTQKGLKKMIVLEGFLYAVIGSIYGAIIACGLSYMMYRGTVSVREFSWQIPWSGIAIAAAAAVAIGYLSVLSPLSRINRENLIDTIREDY
ncbi:MAG: FtsX-like permease family protein [Clostridium sp.]|jgi:putative ABC transport system permease protein|uniref:ABC transporter permease n=1 Tax=Clostridium sp. TaxID=1506 RepID=UPI0025C33CBD|nr:FtsX-like permease family protein [Clostridium sp.]MCH3963059.1 FtsX-like permease family protein [Clostridium sp.]MCI1716478.1 FtsX-like permease family protein [Clostridium sp.]MCI1800818.1 FtsX-like permease family protein [Clostridium sp.]MCI1814527.1 FtsX-like permease family protein [Clostridium sp.]MCI1871437.1 FtsX-like permease family protein [Clostridium sp.]